MTGDKSAFVGCVSAPYWAPLCVTIPPPPRSHVWCASFLIHNTSNNGEKHTSLSFLVLRMKRMQHCTITRPSRALVAPACAIVEQSHKVYLDTTLSLASNLGCANRLLVHALAACVRDGCGCGRVTTSEAYRKEGYWDPSQEQPGVIIDVGA
jgi:hypothetical protein